MAGYLKVWTSLRSNDGYLSLSGLCRGAYLQLLLWCKAQRDDGIVTASGWTQVGVELGVDRRTARHVCDKIAATLLLTHDKNAQGIITIEIHNYKQWQEIKVEDVLKKLRSNVQKCTPLRPDQTRPDQTTSPSAPDTPKKKKETDTENIPYLEIISDLNKVLGTKYREKTEEIRKGIRRWWKQGFRLEDFKYVHRIKSVEWKQDPKMSTFLRPSTLYGPKFEDYLNQTEAQIEDSSSGLPPTRPDSPGE